MLKIYVREKFMMRMMNRLGIHCGGLKGGMRAAADSMQNALFFL